MLNGFSDNDRGATLILRLICPGCKKDSYSASAEAFKPCPYCGIVFSGKYGTNQRSCHRIRKEIPCILPYEGQFLQANTVDISDRGFSIKIFGQPSLPVGDILDLHVKDIPIKAQVVWVANDPKAATAMTGFRVLDGRLNFL